MNTKLLEKQNEKFYTARYDRAFKEIFLKEKNQAATTLNLSFSPSKPDTAKGRENKACTGA